MLKRLALITLCILAQGSLCFADLEVEIVGLNPPKNNRQKAHVHSFDTATGTHSGLVVQTEPVRQFRPEFHPFLNDTFGTAMNQDVTFFTTGNILHDGGNSSSVDTGNADTDSEFFLEDTGATWGTGTSAGQVQIGMTVEETAASDYARISTVTATKLGLTTIGSKGVASFDMFEAGNEAYIINAVWTGTATVGTWDFSTSNVITQAAGNNNDQADIEAVAADQSFADDFTALTGAINLNTYSDTNHNISMQMTLAGSPIGVSVLLNNFIDTGDFGAQQFVIPIGDFEIGNQLTNGVRIIIIRNGGAKPAFTLDNIRLEVSGTQLVYKATTPVGTLFHITEIRIRIEDVISAVLTDNSMPNIDPGSILGVSALTNGIVFSRVEDGVTLFSLTIKTLGDFLATGSDMINISGNATNTGFTLLVRFSEPIILKGGSAQNFLSFTISDNLSNLTKFTAAARGALEIN